MITILEAQAVAQSHARSKGEILPGIYYAIKNIKEYSPCYYFDYFIVDGHGNFPDEYFAGTPVFTVDKKTADVEVVTCGKLSELR